MGIINYEVSPINMLDLVKMAADGNLIPIFGAGFSAGCQAANGIVPNGSQAKNDMSAMILERNTCQRFNKEKLESLDFFSVAALFFECVDIKDRAEYFEKKYTEVKLYRHCADFLNKVNWPYAYTINVDDAIEGNSDFFEILPYHKFKRSITNKRLLYKLHGDAVYESKYINENVENIVFSQRQYVQAMNDEHNAEIYKALLADYSEKNILYIGCNLEKEVDLQNVFNASRSYAKETYRFVIRTKEPDIQEEINLKNHGINRVLLVKNYERFYTDFVTEYVEFLSKRNKGYKFTNPGVITIEGKKESIDLISGKSIFDMQNNIFKKSSLHVLRNAVSTIIDSFRSNNVLLLKGRRFSGKTFVLCSLIEQYRNIDKLYFPSTTLVDSGTIERLLKKQRNSVFLFDSNSLSSDSYVMVLTCEEWLSSNGNKVIVVANSNDNFLLSKIDGEPIELSNEFNSDELNYNKRVADLNGLIRRKETDTNIDYLYRIEKEQRIDVSLFSSADISFTPKEKAVLIALCSLDKLFSSDIIALGMVRSELECMCEKMTPFIEEIEIDLEEKDRHSSTKLVHNSKLVLIDILSRFDFSEILSGIIYIVRRFKPDYSRRRLYIEVILFDTMNQIFTAMDSKGVDRIEQINIPKIYEKLQPYLSDDLHYWLQRAKSIYRTTSDYESLKKAYSYAMKTYRDSRPKSRLYISAALTLSLILCAMGRDLEYDNKLNTYEEALIYADEAVNSDFYRRNPRYLNSELPKGKNTNSERRILTACRHVLENSKSDYCKQKAQDLKKYFEE